MLVLVCQHCKINILQPQCYRDRCISDHFAILDDI